MIVFDSSVWIEWWSGGDARRDAIRAAVTGAGGGELLVPATVVFESHRWLLRSDAEEHEIDDMSSSLDHYRLVPLDATLAREAAQLSQDTKLAAADAAILATAREHRATLLTYDTDFEGLEGVVVLER